jgi:hypothetical protein
LIVKRNGNQGDLVDVVGLVARHRLEKAILPLRGVASN